MYIYRSRVSDTVYTACALILRLLLLRMIFAKSSITLSK